MATTHILKVDDVTTGMHIVIGYGICHLVLVLVVSIGICVQSRHVGQSLSIKHFVINLWKERGIYTPLLIHISATATDLAVLYEWHQLAEYERAGSNLQSLDMHQFFWTALGFMIVYRSLLGLLGSGVFVWGFIENIDDICCGCDWIDKCFNQWETCGNKCCLCYIPFYIAIFTTYLIIFLVLVVLGFVFGALELMIYLGIYWDFKEKQNSGSHNKGAGMTQKVCQSMAILESLPEVIMQSVFVMRAVNDEKLDQAAGDIHWLISISMIVSLLSITSKYIWIDGVMVRDSAKDIFPRKEDFGEKPDAEELLGTYGCIRTRYLSYGYIIRTVWRLSAVIARFVIFALIWVVLGGAFEVVMILTMMVVWYLAIFSIAFCGDCALITSQIKTGFKKLKRSQRILHFDNGLKQSICGFNWFVDFFAIVLFSLAVSLVVGGILVVLCLVGVVFQLGITVITGKAIYLLRTVENCFLMGLISIFAFARFDCWRCADNEQRNALGNDRIMAWLISGWIAVLIHMVMTIKIQKVIDKEYDMNVGTIIKDVKEDLEERYQEYLNVQQRIIRNARLRGLVTQYTSQQIANMITNKLIPDCPPCTRGDIIKVKLVPKRVCRKVQCDKCSAYIDLEDDEGIDMVWHCVKEAHTYHLCIDCGHIEGAKPDVSDKPTPVEMEDLEAVSLGKAKSTEKKTVESDGKKETEHAQAEAGDE